MIQKLLLLFFTITILSTCQMDDGFTYALIKTDYGDMKVKLFNSTPLHRDNFIKLANDGYYEDLLFHRVIQGFMIQGGDPASKNAAPGAPLGSGGPGYTIPAEIGALHYKGALSAARLSDAVNPAKASSGSQFYIVQGAPVQANTLDRLSTQHGHIYTDEEKAKYAQVGGTSMLDYQYTVFGEVVEGIEVIDSIAAVRTQSDRPLEDVKMKIQIVN